jgi:hypothetical protein
MRGYDGKQKRAMILRASIEFRYQGQRIRQRFRVVEETDDDLMVLGLPWLQRLNPDIDWKKRIVTLRKASKDPRRTIETPALEEAKEASKKPSHDKKKPTGFGKRGGYGGDQFKKTKEQMHHRFVPSFFKMNSVGAADSDRDTCTLPSRTNSSSCLFASIASSRLNGLCLHLGILAPSLILISRSKGPCSGNCYFFLQNTSAYSLSSCGNLSRTSVNSF